MDVGKTANWMQLVLQRSRDVGDPPGGISSEEAAVGAVVTSSNTLAEEGREEGARS